MYFYKNKQIMMIFVLFLQHLVIFMYLTQMFISIKIFINKLLRLNICEI